MQEARMATSVGRKGMGRHIIRRKWHDFGKQRSSALAKFQILTNHIMSDEIKDVMH